MRTIRRGGAAREDRELEYRARHCRDAPDILAGGLNAANIKLAIRSVRPFGVDVSVAGVESSPGVKDPGRLRSFFEALRDTRFGRRDPNEAATTAITAASSYRKRSLRLWKSFNRPISMPA